ncbi:mitochondrial intermediate peptidase-like [Bolinopsis microptera]|uniref:mitochondrial intermediate peptidase-like n=1 Tax=Bolinopsis microptera TaxID=2820187 RepID=UPI00307A87EA
MIRYLPRHTYNVLRRYLTSQHSLEVPKPVENRAVNNKPLYDTLVVRSPANTDIEDILNKKQQISVNDEVNCGLFGLDRTDLEDHFTLVTSKCDDLLHQLETSSTDETLELADDLVRNIVSVGDMALFLAQSTSDKRDEGRELLKQAEVYMNKLNNSSVIFSALKRLVEDTETWEQMEGESRRAVLMLLVDCKNNGSDQIPEKHTEIQTLIKQVGKEGISFVKETVVPVRIPIEECHDSLLSLPEQDNKIVLSDWADESTSDAIREHAWRNYYKHDPKKEALLHNLLKKRHKLAQATGYNNYAERVLQGSMAGSPAVVKEFIEETHEQIRPAARDEMYEMEKIKYMQSSHFYNKGYHAVSEVVVSPWDTGYIAEDYRKLYIKEESRIIVPHLADFLSVGSVVEQIGVWMEDTFGVTLVAEQPIKGELWHSDVIKLAVEHEKEGISGLLYLDFYTSDKKRSPPCNHVIRSRTNKQLPISVVECNYTLGNGYRPPHLNVSTFEKLFRELGSAIHIMLGRNKHHQTSASCLSPDMKLISGYLHQNLAQSPTVLNHIMKHHTRTGVLPRVNPVSVQAITNAQLVFRAHEVEQQLAMSAVDLSLHTDFPFSDGRSSTDVYSWNCEKYTHLPYIEDTAPHLRSHQLYTQGGQVYSHLWCKAIANILHKELFVIDPFSRHAGEYFREHFLQHGAGKRPREMVEYLTGTKLTADRLANALVAPIEHASKVAAGFKVFGDGMGGKQWWHRDVSGSPDSALFSRLSSTHPHLVGPEGNLKVPPPFDREGMVRLREQTGRVAVEDETGKVNQQIADS